MTKGHGADYPMQVTLWKEPLMSLCNLKEVIHQRVQLVFKAQPYLIIA